MNIVTKEYDYYDYLKTVYGKDNKIKYVRKTEPLTIDQALRHFKLYDDCVYKNLAEFECKTFTPPIFQQLNIEDNNFKMRYYSIPATDTYLIVCGKAYPIIWYDDFNNLCSLEARSTYTKVHPVVYVPEKHSHLFKDNWFAEKNDKIWGIEQEPLKEISKYLKKPVFVLSIRNAKEGKYAQYDPPLLNTLGFENIYPADQIYQDISYYISNVLNDSPDVKPKGKPPQTNKEKIVSHGFDVKTSFRKSKTK